MDGRMDRQTEELVFLFFSPLPPLLLLPLLTLDGSHFVTFNLPLRIQPYCDPGQSDRMTSTIASFLA